MGRLSDRIGSGRTLLFSIVAMPGGVGFSIIDTLIGKLIGIALITYGFCGAHSAAAASAGSLDDSDKARIPAMYMLFCRVGASVIGTAGGKFLLFGDRSGIVIFLAIVLSLALSFSFLLLKTA